MDSELQGQSGPPHPRSGISRIRKRPGVCVVGGGDQDGISMDVDGWVQLCD